MKCKINIKLVLFLINFFCTSLIASFTVPTQDIDMCTPGSVLAQVSPSGGTGPFTYSLIAGPMFGQVSSFDTSSGGFEYSLNPIMPGITMDTVKVLVTDSLGATGLGIVNFEINKDLTPILVKRVCENSSYSLVVQNELPIQGFNFGAYDFLGYQALFTGVHGTFTPGANFAATGAYTYKPVPGFTGLDLITIGITPTYINGVVFNGCQLLYNVENNIIGGPSTENASYKLCFNGNITAFLPSATGGTPPYTYSSTGPGPQHASFFSLGDDGLFSYFPTSGFVGTDSFKYFATDATGCSNVNSPSTATLQVGSTIHLGVSTIEECPGQSVVGTYQVTGGIPPYDYFLISGPAHGTVTSGPISSPTFLYRSDTGYIGTDNFTFGITDAGECGSSNFGSIHVVIGTEGLPVSLTACQGSTTTGHFSGTGGSGSYILYTPTSPAHGVVTSPCSFACTTFNYTPSIGYTGPDSFTYYVTDTQNCSGTVGIVSVLVDGIQAFPLSLTGCGNTPINGQLQAIGGIAPLVFTINGGFRRGQGNITAFNPATGSFTFQFTVPDPSFVLFNFTVTDSLGCSSNLGFVQITAEATPQVSPFSFSVCEDGSVSGVLTATGCTPTCNFTFTGPLHGSINPFNSSTGAYTYNATGIPGPDSFSYQAINQSDGCISNSALVTISVSHAVAPRVPNLMISSCENGTVTSNLTASGGSGNYQYAIVSGPTSGSLPLVNLSTGEFIYQTSNNFTGIASFTYDVTDQSTGCMSNIGTVTIGVGCH